MFAVRIRKKLRRTSLQKYINIFSKIMEYVTDSRQSSTTSTTPHGQIRTNVPSPTGRVPERRVGVIANNCPPIQTLCRYTVPTKYLPQNIYPQNIYPKVFPPQNIYPKIFTPVKNWTYTPDLLYYIYYEEIFSTYS